MFKKFFTILAAIALASCNSGGDDGYKFETKQYEKNQVTVEFVTFKSISEFKQAARKHKLNPDTVVAFSSLHPPLFDKCTIYMIDPTVSYDPTFLGHELTHCHYGQWHPNALQEKSNELKEKS